MFFNLGGNWNLGGGGIRRPAGFGAPAAGPAVGPLQGGGGAQVPGGNALPGSWNPASGGIPATTPPTQSLAELIAGISQNLSGLGPIISGITGSENQALRDQYPAEYFGALGTTIGNVANRAKGYITDLLPQMQQGAAEYGLGEGVSGSPNANSKLLRDLGLTAYGVQRDALQDLGRVQDAIPKVAPYSPNRLIPDIGQQIQSDYMRNFFGSAPIPESAFQRNLALANQGLSRGFNAGSGPGGGGGFRPFQTLPAPQFFNPGAPGMPATTPNIPGWGQAWNNEGGFAQAGNVPGWADPGGGFAGPEWDQFFDLSIDEPFMDQGAVGPVQGPAWNGGGLFDPIFDQGQDWFDDEFFE